MERDIFVLKFSFTWESGMSKLNLTIFHFTPYLRPTYWTGKLQHKIDVAHGVLITVLTRALMGLQIFHALMRGVIYAPPPPNSAPRASSEKRKRAIESSSKIIKKVFRSFFR